MSVLDATSSYSCTSVNCAAGRIQPGFSAFAWLPDYQSAKHTACEQGWTAGHERLEAELPSIISSSRTNTICKISKSSHAAGSGARPHFHTWIIRTPTCSPGILSTNEYSPKVRSFARPGRSTLHQVARSVPETKATGDTAQGGVKPREIVGGMCSESRISPHRDLHSSSFYQHDTRSDEQVKPCACTFRTFGHSSAAQLII
ncbi:hypothetical protein KVT40_004258 [Elsinoe batatas]|uniref:Uncharacterized protein n=1 Tax=Elsinoe batatas TaxID=2601811 RepID=A0A8K0L3T3_9PEZI|nr:hypothetical protein KVT40_004258 [Elsinoe batatas]